MKKKLVLTIAIVAIFTCMLAIFVSAEDIEYKGIYYTLNSNGTATVSSANRTECKLAIVEIPKTISDKAGNVYNVTAIANECFGNGGAQGNQYLEELYIPSTIVSVGKQLARGCSSLRKVVISSQDTVLLDGTFWSCSSLQELDMSGMENLTRIESIAVGAPVSSLKLPSSLTTVGGKAFQSGNITSLVLPSGLTTIGGNAFQFNDFVTLVIPASVNSVSAAAFHNVSTIKTLVLANTSFEGWSKDSTTFNGVNPDIIFFAGSNPTTLTKHYTQWASYKTMTYTNYLANPSAATAKTIVYGTQNCTCGYIKTNEEPTFNFTSYTEKMTLTKTCSHCKNVNILKSIDPMFINLGFSAAQYGDMMSVNYKVNAQAIAEYEKITGEKVNYGVFAVKASNIGDNDIFDENGEERQGVIAADITDCGFNLFNLKIMGFDEDQKTIDLAMGAFVKTEKNGTVKYSYLQIAEPTNGKYYLASYNDVVALLKEENI